MQLTLKNGKNVRKTSNKDVKAGKLPTDGIFLADNVMRLNMVDRADISGVLDQIRSMQSEIHQASRVAPSVKPSAEVDAAKAADAPDFSEMLKAAIDKVNEVQQSSSSLQKSYLQGDPNVDITDVMIASQKSGVAFDAMVQVRNKLVDSYRDVMNMPI